MTRKEAIFKLIEYRRRLEQDFEGTEYVLDAEPFDIAVQALSKPEQKWNKFAQKQDPDTGLWEWVEPLPKDGQHILVSISLEGHEPVQDDSFYEDGSGCWLDSGYSIGNEAVAWMEMPEPYKEEQK